MDYKGILMPYHKICVDFDGVIYENKKYYGKPWILRDGPLQGTLEALKYLSTRYIVYVYSTRCGSQKGYEAVKEWIKDHGLDPYVVVVNYKPVALVYLDDRGVTFQGDWQQAIENIKRFEQWQGKISPYTISKPCC